MCCVLSSPARAFHRADSALTWLVASAAFGQGVNIRSVSLVANLGLPQDPLELYQEWGRIRLQGLAVVAMRPRYTVERLTLPSDESLRPVGDLRLREEGVVQLLAILTAPFCLRRSIVGWLGGSVRRCSGCDACVALGHGVMDADCCGAIPYGQELVRARRDAVLVLRTLPPDDWQLLTAILDTPPVAAEAPFAQQHTHALLVLSLVGSRRIEVKLQRGQYGNVVALARPATGALHELRMRGDEIFVWLASADILGTGAEGKGATPLPDVGSTGLAALRQSVRFHLARARAEIATAWQLMEPHGLDMSPLELQLDELVLLGSLHEPLDEPGVSVGIGVSESACTTPTPMPPVARTDSPRSKSSAGGRLSGEKRRLRELSRGMQQSVEEESVVQFRPIGNFSEAEPVGSGSGDGEPRSLLTSCFPVKRSKQGCGA